MYILYKYLRQGDLNRRRSVLRTKIAVMAHSAEAARQSMFLKRASLWEEGRDLLLLPTIDIAEDIRIERLCFHIGNSIEDISKRLADYNKDIVNLIMKYQGIARINALGSFADFSWITKLIVNLELDMHYTNRFIESVISSKIESTIKDVSMASIRNTKFTVDMPSWKRTVYKYSILFRTTLVDSIVFRVSRVCSKLVRPKFLKSVPSLKKAAEKSAMDQVEFYKQKSNQAGKWRNPEDLMFVEWMLSQYHGWGVHGNYGKRKTDAKKWLPRVRRKIPRIRYGLRKNFYKNLRSAAKRLLDSVSKPRSVSQIVRFLIKSIAAGADQMINRNHGELTPNRNSELLKEPSRFWSRRAAGISRKDLKMGRTSKKTGRGVGFGKVYGTRNNPGARVFVPGKMFKRAIQPYVGSMFSIDKMEMQKRIHREISKRQRESRKMFA